MLAVEVEGGVHTGGRHTRGEGYERDIVKYNAATLAGWQLYRFTPGQIDEGYAGEQLLAVFSAISQH